MEEIENFFGDFFLKEEIVNCLDNFFDGGKVYKGHLYIHE